MTYRNHDQPIWLPNGGNPTSSYPAGNQCCLNGQCSSSNGTSPCDKWEGWYVEITVAGTREGCNSEYISEWVNIHINSPYLWPEHEELAGTHIVQYFNLYGKEGELISDEVSQDIKISRKIKGDTIQIYFYDVDLGVFNLKFTQGIDPCEETTGSLRHFEYVYTWICDTSSP